MKTWALLLLIVILIAGCTGTPPEEAVSVEQITLTDATSRQVVLSANPIRVVAFGASLAEIWLNAGGSLVGVTSDALDGHSFSLSEDIAVVGTIKDPVADLVLSLQPELVILSPDIVGHTNVASVLDQADIPYYFATADNFEDYLLVLKDFTQLTGAHENYTLHGTAQQDEIDTLLSQCVLPESDTSILVLRAFSSGVKVKADGIVATEILEDFGVRNIAAAQNSLLEELSMEVILEENPDYIFLVIMGDDTEAAMASLESSLSGHPAWATLDAVNNQNFIILPKELFHFKPNSRWQESYRYLYEILCAQ